MCDVLESESEPVASGLQPRSAVDEKHCVVDERVLAEFREEQLGQCLYSRRIEPYMEQAAGVGINRSVQPVALVAEPDHGFIHRNVIRIGTLCGL